MRDPKIYTSTTLIGEKVKNKEGEDLGEITELLIDTDSGKIEYGVLAFGGFLGMGNKNFAIPYEALTLEREEDFFILNVDKSTLENAVTQIEYQGKSYYIY